nr:MAG TPA: hypothetical protein [Caudoviricetes sp.]
MEVIKLPHCGAISVGWVVEDTSTWPTDNAKCACIVKLLDRALCTVILPHLESLSVVLPFVGNIDSVRVFSLGKFDGHFCFSLSLGWFVVSSLSGCWSFCHVNYVTRLFVLVPDELVHVPMQEAQFIQGNALVIGLPVPIDAIVSGISATTPYVTIHVHVDTACLVFREQVKQTHKLIAMLGKPRVNTCQVPALVRINVTSHVFLHRF